MYACEDLFSVISAKSFECAVNEQLGCIFKLPILYAQWWINGCNKFYIVLVLKGHIFSHRISWILIFKEIHCKLFSFKELACA